MLGALVAVGAASSLADRGYSLPSLDSAPGGGRVAPLDGPMVKQKDFCLSKSKIFSDSPGGLSLQI